MDRPLLIRACREFLQAHEAQNSPVNQMLGPEVKAAMARVTDDSAAALGRCFSAVTDTRCVTCGFSTSSKCVECGGLICGSCQWEHSNDSSGYHCKKCCGTHCKKCCSENGDRP